MKTPGHKKQCQSRNLKSGIKDNFKGESVKLVRCQINVQNAAKMEEVYPLRAQASIYKVNQNWVLTHCHYLSAI